MRSAVLIIVFVLAAGAVPARAEFYRWTDRDGKEFYTNEKEKIPAEYQNTARPVEVRDERVNVGQKPAAAGAQKVKKTPEHKDKYGHGEEYWRARAGKLRRQLREQQQDYDDVLKQIETHERQATAGGSSARGKKASGTASLRKKKSQLEKKIARTRRELEVDLPEEARKADAYPGWLRE